MNKIIGIDLGTTKSVVGYCSDDGKPVIIPFDGKPYLESSIYISADKKVFIGKQAYEMQLKEITKEKKGFLIEAVKRRVGKETGTKVGDWKEYPQYLYAYILAEIKYHAEKHLGQEVHDAIIAIPSHFDINQRRATKEAAELIGLNIRRLLNEATASAMAYVARYRQINDETILIFDFGGGTLDISIVEYGDSMFEVKCIEGDSEIGGIDYSNALNELFIEEYRSKYINSGELNDYEKYTLKEKIEKAKIELSNYENANISLVTSHGLVDVCIKRSALESRTGHIKERVIHHLKKTLKAGGVNNSEIDKVVMIGRTSNLSFIKAAVNEVIDKRPVLFANEITCVAEGAIIQAGILQGFIKNTLLLDVISCNLGIETMGGLMQNIIPVNTTIPTKKNETYTTTEDSQTSVEVKVYEGMTSRVKENRFVQSFVLDNIPPAPRGIPQIEVEFNIDENGLLSVIAKDKATGKENSIRCELTHSLPPEKFASRKAKLKEWLENRKNS